MSRYVARHMQCTCSQRVVEYTCLFASLLVTARALLSAFFPAFHLCINRRIQRALHYRKIDKRPSAARHDSRLASVTKYKGKPFPATLLSLLSMSHLYLDLPLHPLLPFSFFFFIFFISLRNRACRIYGHLPLV